MTYMKPRAYLGVILPATEEKTDFKQARGKAAMKFDPVGSE